MSDELTDCERDQVLQALDFQIWKLCDDLKASIGAVQKLDETEASRQLDDVITAVAALASEHNGGGDG